MHSTEKDTTSTAYSEGVGLLNGIQSIRMSWSNENKLSDR